MPFRTFFLCLLTVAAGAGAAPGQSTAPPPPPATTPPPGQSAPAPPAKPAVPGGRDGRERMIREALQKLPPEKRRQVLEAMKAVWADEDVRTAREKLRQATEDYRRTLRAAMEETDPEVRNTVRPLLERLLKAGLNASAWDDPTAPLPADPSAPATQAAPPRYLRLLGLSGDRLAALSPENRSLVSGVRDRVMADPRVRQAAAAVAAQSDQPKARAQAMQELRRVAREVAVELEPKLKSLLESLPGPRP